MFIKIARLLELHIYRHRKGFMLSYCKATGSLFVGPLELVLSVATSGNDFVLSFE